ncbi:MAG: putative rane transporter protein [Tardiphaga sp.]|nr:putative rane transporter protein [Tardiphaga sp.]
MPPIISDPYFYCAAIPAVILLGLSKGGFVSVGMTATPLLALYLPPLEAAALLLPVLISQDLISIYVYRRDWDASNLKVLIPGAVIGMACGWLIASHVSDNAVRIAIGSIGLSFVGYMWLRRAIVEPSRMSAASGVFWGALSGFTSFMTQGGSPPFQVYVLPQRLPKLVLVGTTTMFFSAVNAMKIVPYFMLGQFTPVNLSTSLTLLPVAVGANFIGVWLVRHTPTYMFYRIAYTLLLLISLTLLWQGGSNLLAR